MLIQLFIMWLREARAFNLVATALPRPPMQETARGAGRAAAIIAGDRVWYKNEDDHCFLMEPEQEVETRYFYRKGEMVRSSEINFSTEPGVRSIYFIFRLSVIAKYPRTVLCDCHHILTLL